MKTFRRTALALAAQVTALSTGLAQAQTTDAPKPQAQSTQSQQLETVVVKGRRAALASAQKLKQDADEIVDSIVADEIGKLPDRSVTEVLQRIVGVQMDRVQAISDPVHYSVEGSGVAVRGLSYVTSQFNGRETFSANRGRSLGFEDVPPELMAGVDVYKNPSAEQIEGAIGGLVNLRTALPFDFPGFKASLSANVTRSQLAAKNKPTISGLISNTWDTEAGKFGALLDLAHSLSATRSDAIVLDPYYKQGQSPTATNWVLRDVGWRQQRYDRTRDGLYGALQWKKDSVESSLTFFRSKYKFDWNEFNVIAQMNPADVNVLNGTFDGNNVFVKGTLTGKKNADGSYGGIEVENQTRFSTRSSKSDDLAWKIAFKPDDQWTLTSDLQYVRSKTNNFDSTVGTAVQIPRVEVDLTGSVPRATFDAATNAALADPSKYYWAMMMDHLDKGKATQKAWKGDARYVFKDNRVLNDVRFGVRVAQRNAETINSTPGQDGYNWATITHAWQVGWNIGDLAYITKGDVPTTRAGFGNFLGGKTQAPTLYFPTPAVAFGWPDSYNKLHQLYLNQCSAFKPDWGGGNDGCFYNKNSTQGGGAWHVASFGTDPAGRNAQKETTTAAYGQLRFGFDDLGVPLEGNVGLRVVRTQGDADGYTSLTAGSAPANAVGVPVAPLTSFANAQTFRNSYTDALPSLNLRYKLADNLQLRFALARAISRPQLSEMQAYATLKQSVELEANSNPPNVRSVSLTGSASGNPLLKPVKSDQLDLSAEWYFAKNGSLTVAAFNKQLKDIILSQTYVQTIKDNNGKPVDFVVTGPVNAAKGHARGVELAFQTYLDGVSDLLKGFGVQANYTYVDTKTRRYNSVYAPYCSAGQGKDNLNLYINGCDTDGRSFGDQPLVNVSRNTYNLAFMYDQGPISARIAYSWRQKYLYGVGLNTDNTGPNQTNALDTNPASPNYGKDGLPVGLPLWAGDYGQVDAGLHYKLSDQLSFGLEAQNLFNAAYKQYMQQHIGLKLHNYFLSGRRYTVSMQYSF